MLPTTELYATIHALPSPSAQTSKKDVWRVEGENTTAVTQLEKEWAEWLAATYLPNFPEVITDEVFAFAEDFDNHVFSYTEIEARYKKIANVVTNAKKFSN